MDALIGTRRMENFYKIEGVAPINYDDFLKYCGDHLNRKIEKVAQEIADLKGGKLPFSHIRHSFSELLSPGFLDRLEKDLWLWQPFEFANLVVNEGLDDSLDKHLKGSAYTAAFYVGLTDSTPTPAAGDTMASHAGWAEITNYDEANRQDLTLGTVSSQSVDNSASKAVFTIDTNSTTIGGAFVTTNNTKGGSTGTLYGIGAFSAGDKTLDDNDTLNVTVTATAAAS